LGPFDSGDAANCSMREGERTLRKRRENFSYRRIGAHFDAGRVAPCPVGAELSPDNAPIHAQARRGAEISRANVAVEKTAARSGANLGYAQLVAWHEAVIRCHRLAIWGEARDLGRLGVQQKRDGYREDHVERNCEKVTHLGGRILERGAISDSEVS